jgi:RNA polymerase sigma factor (sigma-70 family)
MTDATKTSVDASLAARTAQLAAHPNLMETLSTQAGAARFGFTTARFVPHLARSAASRFKAQTPSAQELETYLSSLCLEDFALACACSEGHEPAWDFFVSNYRGYLRRCAGAMLRRSAESAEARDLADSLFAELYGLADGRRGSASLFRYFHGRSSLKTWLRAVLAQRHVDGIRAARRFDSLDEADAAGQLAVGEVAAARGQKSSPRPSTEHALGPLAIPPDPHRERYILLFRAALESALQKLDPADHRRMCLYYAEGKTLAQVGRLCGEHESSVSRNLERIRRTLRAGVEEDLRRGARVDRVARRDGATNATGASSAASAGAGEGLSDAQVALCLQYATEDAPIDFNALFPAGDKKLGGPENTRSNTPRENS